MSVQRVSSHECAKTVSSHECATSDVSQDTMHGGVRRGALLYSLYFVSAMLKFCQL